MDRNLNPPPPDLPLLHHLQLSLLRQRLVKFKSGKMAATAAEGAAALPPASTSSSGERVSRSYQVLKRTINKSTGPVRLPDGAQTRAGRPQEEVANYLNTVGTVNLLESVLVVPSLGLYH